MGAKVSKAKRPKRRWIGITIPASIQTKQELLAAIESSNLSEYEIKLYDTYFSNTDVAAKTRFAFNIEDDVGIAIICVLLSEYRGVRSYLASKDNLEFTSISSSGKIRLVRERMGLSKPARR